MGLDDDAATPTAAERIASRTATVVTVASGVEMAAIVPQVVRGQQSHVNKTTSFNAAGYATMGATIVVISPAPSSSRSASGREWSSLAQPDYRATAASSARTVAAPLDGGPALPFLGWRATGGDLRIAHFIGMHALQTIPLLALALTVLPADARLTSRTRVQIVLLAALGYAGAVALTLWQALRGQAVVHPDRITVSTAADLAVVLGCGLLVLVHDARRQRSDRGVPVSTREPRPVADQVLSR